MCAVELFPLYTMQLLKLTVIGLATALIRRVAYLPQAQWGDWCTPWRQAEGRNWNEALEFTRAALMMNLTCAKDDRSGVNGSTFANEHPGFATSVDYSPADIVRRQSSRWQGLQAR